MTVEERIQIVEARNAKVEQDKAWETSMTRKVTIAILTYVIIVLFFLAAELPKPFINPIVPTVGFILSTLSMKFVRTIWGKKI
jgi:hypothetical protein